jgi:hypothetical protein
MPELMIGNNKNEKKALKLKESEKDFDDPEFERLTREALDKYEKGEFKKLSPQKFLKKLAKW